MTAGACFPRAAFTSRCSITSNGSLTTAGSSSTPFSPCPGASTATALTTLPAGWSSRAASRSTGRGRRLARCYLAFVLDALDPAGACHNRMAADGQWRDEAGVGDWWGRALWGLGVAAASAPTPGMRARALGGFRLAAQCRSPHLRAMAFAALGAEEVLRTRPDEIAAVRLLTGTLAAIGEPADDDPRWPWPEERLSYGNASIAEALIVAGDALSDAPALDRGLELLEFLLRTETRDGHLSVTPVGGRGRDDARPRLRPAAHRGGRAG